MKEMEKGRKRGGGACRKRGGLTNNRPFQRLCNRCIETLCVCVCVYERKRESERTSERESKRERGRTGGGETGRERAGESGRERERAGESE